jgi:hypothetical protein
MIDTIITKRSNGNSTVAITTKTKLILKGVNPDRFTAASEDDTAVIARLETIAIELGVRL